MGVKRIYLKIAYASFGMLMGFSAFMTWNIVYEQPWTAAMGGLSGKYAANTPSAAAGAKASMRLITKETRHTCKQKYVSLHVI